MRPSCERTDVGTPCGKAPDVCERSFRISASCTHPLRGCLVKVVLGSLQRAHCLVAHSAALLCRWDLLEQRLCSIKPSKRLFWLGAQQHRSRWRKSHIGFQVKGHLCHLRDRGCTLAARLQRPIWQLPRGLQAASKWLFFGATTPGCCFSRARTAIPNGFSWSTGKRKSYSDGVVCSPTSFQTACQEQHDILTSTSVHSVSLGHDAPKPSPRGKAGDDPASFSSFATVVPYDSLIAKQRLVWPPLHSHGTCFSMTMGWCDLRLSSQTTQWCGDRAGGSPQQCEKNKMVWCNTVRCNCTVHYTSKCTSDSDCTSQSVPQNTCRAAMVRCDLRLNSKRHAKSTMRF